MGWFSSISGFVHGALDLAGFIPGVGAVADLANAAIYAAEGDWVNAGLSAVSAIPGIGDSIALASKSAKVIKGMKLLSKAEKAEFLLKIVKGKVTTGAKLLKKLNPKGMFQSIKNFCKKACVEGKCFTGDTLVYTEMGFCPIDNIRPGDLVFSEDEETGQTGWKKVLSVSASTAHTIYTISTGQGKIRTTGYHPFYREGDGWVNAINLAAGDILRLDGGAASIEAIEKIRSDEGVEVYNLQIEDWHSFFVSEEKVYVHNGIRHFFKGIKTKLKGALTKAKEKLKCFFKGEPVDLVTGVVYQESMDFELPGTIPLCWERRYYSDSIRSGALGFGTFLNYETALEFSEAEGLMVLLLPDGRGLEFDPEDTKDGLFERTEQLEITKTPEGYQIYFFGKKLYYVYEWEKAPGSYALSAIHDGAGHFITFQYQGEVLTQITDTAGRKLSVKTDNHNRVTEVTLKDRVMVSYSYSQAGDLVRVGDALNQIKTMEYQNHRMVKATTREGCSFYWEYDGEGRRARCIHTWGDNGTLDYRFEYGDGVSYSTDSLGNREAVYYNEDGLITRHVDAEGHSTEYTYNEYEKLVSIQDAAGGVTSFSYDDKGNMESHTKPSGAKASFLYDSRGHMTEAQYPNGGFSRWLYDEEGRLQKAISPDQSETCYEYNDAGLLCASVDALGNRTAYTYDQWGNLSGVIYPDGSRSLYEYDFFGNCIRSVNPLGGEQLLSYDSLNRIIKAKMTDGNVASFQYNAHDKITRLEDKRQKARYEYTWSGQLKRRLEADREMRFSYDPLERLEYIWNEKGEQYTFTYDGKGNIIKETTFDGLCYTYEYDGAGCLLKTGLPDGTQRVFSYDPDGNVTQICYPDGSVESFQYDCMGLLIMAKNAASTITYEYDKCGRVTKAFQDGHILEYQYDALGRNISIRDEAGLEIKQGYSTAGELNYMEASAPAVCPWTSKMEQNALGLETKRELPGLNSIWTYDEAGLPTAQVMKGAGGSKLSADYQWDVNRRLKEVVRNEQKTSVLFDAWGNPEASMSGKEIHFRSLDETGSVFETKEHTDRHYGAGGRLLEKGSTRYKYDEKGNLLRKEAEEGTWSYEYTGSGLLKRVLRPDGREVSFQYDALGRRIEKSFDGTVTRFLWDGDVLLKEWTEGKEQEAAVWIFEESSYSPSARLSPEGASSIMSDYLGTPIAMYNQEGKRIWYREADLYGRTIRQEGRAEECPFRFPGQYEDVETGLYYNRFRYYSPEEGIYTQQDPIRLNGGWNFYGYVSNTFISMDPLGLAPPNGGNGAVHGDIRTHDKFINSIIDSIRDNYPNATNIRKNQAQHNVHGEKVGRNRPDIQYDLDGKHYNIEVDTTQRGSVRHQNVISKNDPYARNTFLQIDGKTGKATGGFSQIEKKSGDIMDEFSQLH